MTVSSTGSTTSTSSTTSGNQLAITNGSDLQNTFMKLLVAQLKNQDPLNPMDNSQMTSQLAQINTVNGIQQLNTTMSSMLTQNATTQASSMIGRSVQVPTNNLTLASGAANFGVSVPNGADDVVVTITNAAGVAVRTVDLGQMGAAAATTPGTARTTRAISLPTAPTPSRCRPRRVERSLRPMRWAPTRWPASRSTTARCSWCWRLAEPPSCPTLHRFSNHRSTAGRPCASIFYGRKLWDSSKA